MPEPISIFLLGALAFNAAVVGLVAIAEAIAKFFEKIGEFVLGRHFRALKDFMNLYKKDGYLPPSRKY